jgi:Zn-dependent protease
MKRFRSLIALSLSLALILLSPGSSAYHAAAQTMGAATGATAATGVTGSVGANLGRSTGVNAIPALSPSALSLAPVLSAPSILPSAQMNAAAIPMSAAAPTVANTAITPALNGILSAPEKAMFPGAKEVAPAKSAIQTLKTVLSAPSIESSDSKSPETRTAELRRQFDGEALKSELSAPAVSGESIVKAGRAALAASKKGVPDQDLDENGRPANDGGIDELGNARRTGGEQGPDDRTDPAQGGRGGSALFGSVGMGLLYGGAAVAAGLSFGTIAMFPMIILSLVLHEIGHARMAAKLGDVTPRFSSYQTIDFKALLSGRWSMQTGLPKVWKQADRGSLNPLTWGSHIDPIQTVLIPLVTFMTMGFIFGGARPVQMDPELRYFKNPVKDMALVALAGPAVNVGLAMAGALAVTGAVAAGLGTAVVATLGMFVFLNVLLAIFNMIPLPPLDGSHILKAFLPDNARVAMDNFMGRMGPMGIFLPLMLIFYVAGGAIAGASMFVAKLLIGGAMSVTGVQMASSFLPAVAALGLAVGQIAGSPAPSGPVSAGPASAGASAPVDFIVMFGEKKTKLHDSHIANVDVNQPQGVEQYTRLQQAMLAQLETAGLDGSALDPYKGTPLATYARINAATIRVDGGAAAEFTKDMAARGFTVYTNAERKIIRPVPVTPEQMDPAARNAVTMDENLKIVKADVVQAEAVKLWGKPELGFWSGLWAKVFKSAPVQPKFGVIDSGADLSHPLLKRVKEVKNMTSGENVDDIGHGSWVTSTVLHLAPWSRNTTHYKTFLNGGATLDDILRSLTQAGNDGNLVISNSWGDDQGDPKGPDAQLVLKLAQEGHIMVFAAGNAGSGKNTVGAPAIVTYKDPATGAIRVVSVAAAGRDKKIAYFSSRGPGSPVTAKDPSYKDHRPDLTAVGYNIEGAWPAGLGDADRVDGEKGSVKAISGTSMSTPGVAGALMLLAMMFGVTEKGAKLDAIVVALMSTLEKTGQGADNEGEGFMNVDAAYKALQAKFTLIASDVVRYRELNSRLNSLLRYAAMSSNNPGASTKEFGDALVEINQLNLELAAMKAADKTLAYRAAGPIKRFILNATGAAPKP